MIRTTAIQGHGFVMLPDACPACLAACLLGEVACDKHAPTMECVRCVAARFMGAASCDAHTTATAPCAACDAASLVGATCDAHTAISAPCAACEVASLVGASCDAHAARVRPASQPASQPASKPRAASQPDNGPVLNVKALLPFNWSDPSTAKRGTGPDTRLVTKDVERAARAYAHTAMNGGDGLYTLNWTYQTGPNGARRTERNTRVAASIGAKLAAGRAFYLAGAAPDTCLTLNETRRLLWLAMTEAHARRDVPRIAAGETTARTTASRPVETFPQNQQRHTVAPAPAAVDMVLPPAAYAALIADGWRQLSGRTWARPDGIEVRLSAMRAGALDATRAAIGA